MFRENVLCKAEFIDRISRNTIPVALDLQKLKDPSSREAQALHPWINTETGSDVRNVTGVWVLAPDGRVLGRPFAGVSDFAGKTETLLNVALAAFGPIEPRRVPAVDTQPFRGRGVRPDGGVSLAETVRRKGPDAYGITSPVISSVTLSRQEFAAFAPPQAVPGAEWSLPPEIAKKLCRITSPMCYQHAPQPDWVTQVSLRARVRSVAEGVATLVYEGTIATRYDAGNFKKISIGHADGDGEISEQAMTLAGEGVYDVRSGSMRSVVIVGSGTVLQKWNSTERVPTSGLIEWVREGPEGTAPPAEREPR